MYNLIMVRYSEIALKGKNRSFFEKILISNIKHSLKGLENYRVLKEHGRVYVEFEPKDYEEVIVRVKKIFGIVSLSPVVRVANDMDEIYKVSLIQAKKVLENNKYKTFKIEARRGNKSFEYKSPEIARMVGGYILSNIDELNVDVHNPDFSVNVEVRNSTYVFTEKIDCFGGMPYRSAGKAMLLLSGGIDSPVAGFLMGKRGLEIEAVHYHSYPFTSERAKEKVMDLAKILSKYFGRLRIHSINILEIQKQINENCPSEEMTILSRVFMMKLAEKLAEKNSCKALVTGESLGQVASQTIEGLNVTNSSVKLPVFRPLIAMDKIEIIRVAENIGSFETSILPFEDCCTVFLPDRVVTKPKLEKIERSLSLLDVEKLIDDALENIETQIFHPEDL
ncbi:tRNA uracil 4-sulfurtransferase ThiI [Helicovermis profundi]|uniref:Probable tRNA sulfurtransferase n=1 Tax=Helicovermis profundi TaxID=3065157 RepID=A0AAU9EPC5_9FIRM|nr:tRNA 4-thiouridine(8) synthase ThiI [Clostridia bacterium S502]